MDFTKFKQAVATKFGKMTKGNPELFRTAISKEDVWNTYLNSQFAVNKGPEGE